MFLVRRPVCGRVRWHCFDSADDVVTAMQETWLDGMDNVIEVNRGVFADWRHKNGYKGAGWIERDTEIARQYLRTVMWQDWEVNPGVRDYVDRHYDGGGVLTAAKGKGPYLVTAAE